MRKILVLAIGMAVLTAVVCFVRVGKNATGQATAQDDSAKAEVASSNTTTLRFENLHVNPQVQ